MAAQTRKNSKRDALLQAGIEEINRQGLTGFSVRRVAERCGVSPGAPYKHFENRKGFIAAIIEYVNSRWREQQQQIIEKYPHDTRKQLVELSVAYVQFLVDNPHFRSILMLKDDEFDHVYHRLRGELSSLTHRLVLRYCDEVRMSEEDKTRKLYVVRALIFGAALMFDNGEFPYNAQTIEFVRTCIDREFDLP